MKVIELQQDQSDLVEKHNLEIHMMNQNNETLESQKKILLESNFTSCKKNQKGYRKSEATGSNQKFSGHSERGRDET